jgi:putative transposase
MSRYVTLNGYQKPALRRLLAVLANALAETINGLYKAEVIYKDGPWRGLEQVELATLDWVDWFNNRRLLSSIGDIPPAEYEENYYRQLTQDTAA